MGNNCTRWREGKNYDGFKKVCKITGGRKKNKTMKGEREEVNKKTEKER